MKQSNFMSEIYDISIIAAKRREKEKRATKEGKSYYVDPKAPIKEEDLDSIIDWYEGMVYGLNSISYKD